jgi:hypothetical protein
LQETLDAIDKTKKRLVVDPNSGKLDPSKPIEPADVDELLRLRESLRNLIDVDGPTKPPYHVMRRAYAPTSAVILLLVLGIVGTVVTLVQIVRRWPALRAPRPKQKPSKRRKLCRRMSSSASSRTP